MNTYLIKTIILLFILSLSACDRMGGETGPSEYFEGEIEMIESRGILGTMSNTKITYLLSENKLKREEKFVNRARFKEYAGLIIDLEKDSVQMYYFNRQGEGSLYKLTTQEYRALIENQELESEFPSPFDLSFTVLGTYEFVHQVKDSTKIQGFNADFTQYKESDGSFEQGFFDTKEIRVKRPLLEMAIIHIQPEVNFPLSYRYRTSAWVGPGLVAKDQEEKEYERWIKSGLKHLKKGVDHIIELEASCHSISRRAIADSSFALPAVEFVEHPSLTAFFASFEVAELEEEVEEEVEEKSRWDKSTFKKLKKLEELDWDD